MINRRDSSKKPSSSGHTRDRGSTEDIRHVDDPTSEDSTSDDAASEGSLRGEEDPSDREPSEVERLQLELDRVNDRHLRLAAEFDNFRRRSHTQLGESGTRAQAALVAKLLDVIDDFERVSTLDPDQVSVPSVLEGVELVEKKLHLVLKDAGLEAIDPEGDVFDPNLMEAIMREPAESEEEDDRVAAVLQRGFRFQGHLVRPARVSVRKYDG